MRSAKAAKATPRPILRGGQGPVNVPEGQLHPENADEARMNTEQSERVNGFSDFNSFLAWEMASSDTIDLKKIYCDVAGGLNPGLLLSQLLYWRMPSRNNHTKLTINREGRRWLAKADKDWYAEIRLSKEEVLTARRILEARNLITCKIWKYAGVTVNHISINEPEFLAALAAMINIPEEVRNAGPVNKATRIGAKRPGSRSRKPVEAPTDDSASEGQAAEEKFGNAEKSYSGMRKSRIPEYGKVGFPNTEKPNSGMRKSGIPYTEITTKITSETPAEKNIIIVTDSDEAAPPADDDDDLPFFGNEASLIAEGSSPAVTGNGVTPVTGSVQVQPTGGETGQATDTEKVPPAAAAPVETVDNWAVLALPAVDLDVLLARESRDPVGNATLRRAMSCSDVSRIDHMNDQLAMPLGTTSSNRLVTRDLYTRLTDEEIEAAIVAARVDAKKGVQQFAALGYHALDAMVGFPPTVEVLTKTRKRASGPSAGAPGTALGAAYEVKGAGARAASAPTPPTESQNEAPSPEYQPGAVWQHKVDKTEMTVVKRDGPDVHVLGTTGIQVIRILDLMRLYRALRS